MKRGKSLPLFSSLVYHLPTFASLPRFRCSEQSVNIKAKGGRVCGRVKNWYSKSETFFYLRPHAGQQVKKKPASLFLAYHSFFPFLHKNVFFLLLKDWQSAINNVFHSSIVKSIKTNFFYLKDVWEKTLIKTFQSMYFLVWRF